MKKIFMILFLLFIVITANSNDIVRLNKNQPAPFTGVLLTESEYTRMLEIMLIYNDTKLLEKNMIVQIEAYRRLIELKDKEISYLQKKYELEKNLRLDFQVQLQKNDLKLKVLGTTSAIGISVSIAEFVGIGIFSLMWYNMK